MPRHTNRHGQHQEIHIGEFVRDRIGIVTGSVQRHRPEEYDGFDWAVFRTSAAPAMNGVPCVNVKRSYDKGGYGVYTYTYEGVDNGYDFSDSETTYELDISMSEDPIETLIHFPTLAKKYGWDRRRRQFPQLMPGSSSSSGGLGGSKKSKPNDLYGTDSYLAVGAHYRVTYARRFVPASAVARTNEIVESPPGIELFSLPGWAQRRNWLCLGPRALLRGNASQIEEHYLLSGPRGWNRDIYGRGKLSGGGAGGDSAGGGLSIGGL